MNVPRIIIAGLRGGGGKTFVSVGLTAAFRTRSLRVAPFKKGPDYIDAAWLTMAANEPCRNLDLYLMSPETVLQSFVTSAANSDIAVIEGNRGLFDGMDAKGSYSTAELAKLLECPVVLTVDCTKATRTVGALVLGCQQLDPDVPIRGVILNQTAGSRHESVLRESIEQICGLPVLGTIPRIREQLFPERHLGLVPPQEHDRLTRAIDRVADVAGQYLDLDAIQRVAQEAPALRAGKGVGSRFCKTTPDPFSGPEVARIGIFRDAAFQFYYPENLEGLVREGASLIEISPLRDAKLPPVDALYIGGGFPETLAPALADNVPFLQSLRRAIEDDLPVYAECGGAVFLGEKLIYEQGEYPMVGALPVLFAFQKKPQGHGYVELETVEENPFYPVGESLRGHEFHYTYMQSSTGEDLSFAFQMRRGHGFDGRRDGLCCGNVLACYTHVHALGTGTWAPSLVRAAVRFRSRET
ncbi:MAG: cobyrinate a,c-diamide synthase [Pirellulaceae bacterium]|nr:cobyrinate a,c-diamide synthase [Pirellulaceae bacterium]